MAIVGIVLFALLLLAVPIGIALSSAAAAYIMVDPLLEPTVIFRAFFNFIGRYSLTAIPLWPRLRNFQGEASSIPVSANWTRGFSNGKGFP